MSRVVSCDYIDISRVDANIFVVSKMQGEAYLMQNICLKRYPVHRDVSSSGPVPVSVPMHVSLSMPVYVLMPVTVHMPVYVHMPCLCIYMCLCI